MKKTTQVNKLNALLGITEQVKQAEVRTTGKLVGVTEDEIQKYRFLQGLIYFLQAPQLFTKRKCNNCDQTFMVSRQYVAFCSFLCIRESLRKQGIEWSRAENIEAAITDPQVYNGQEPLWITQDNLLQLREILNSLPLDQCLIEGETKSIFKPQSPDLNPESVISMMMGKTSPSSPQSTQTGTGTGTGKTTSRSRRPKRVTRFTS